MQLIKSLEDLKGLSVKYLQDPMAQQEYTLKLKSPSFNLKELEEFDLLDFYFFQIKFFEGNLKIKDSIKNNKEYSITVLKNFVSQLEEFNIQFYDFESFGEFSEKRNFKDYSNEIKDDSKLLNDLKIRNLVIERNLKIKELNFINKFKDLEIDFESKTWNLGFLKFLLIEAKKTIKYEELEAQIIEERSKYKVNTKTSDNKNIKVFNFQKEDFAESENYDFKNKNLEFIMHNNLRPEKICVDKNPFDLLKRSVVPLKSLDDYADEIMSSKEFVAEKMEEKRKEIEEKKIFNARHFLRKQKEESEEIEETSTEKERKNKMKDEFKEFNIKGNTFRRG